MRLLLLANPDNRRATLFAEAMARRGHAPPMQLSWRRWLAGEDLAGLLGPDVQVRLDSPGEDHRVWRMLAQRGAPDLDARALGEDPTRLGHEAAWYRGLRDALDELDQALERRGARCWSAPKEVALLFDKRLCHAVLDAAEVPLPPAFPAPRSREALWALLERCPRLFLKPAHGSSAAGVVALERRPPRAPGPPLQGWTSTRRDGPHLHNDLRVRRLRDQEELGAILDFLCAGPLHVERWLPKARLGERSIDLRVLCIRGEPRHVVVRASRTPLTNLHLGNQRGDLEALRAAMGEEGWAEAMHTCARAAACFPGCLMLGVDLLLAPDFGDPRIAELNAFGDLLPGLLHRGEDPWEAQLVAAGW